MKIYKWLANIVFFLHWTWIALVVGGIVVQFFFRWYVPINLAIVIGTMISIIIWPRCPATRLENFLTAKYDPNQCYREPFIYHYLKKYFSINCKPKTVARLLFAIAIISVITGILLW